MKRRRPTRHLYADVSDSSDRLSSAQICIELITRFSYSREWLRYCLGHFLWRTRGCVRKTIAQIGHTCLYANSSNVVRYRNFAVPIASYSINNKTIIGREFLWNMDIFLLYSDWVLGFTAMSSDYCVYTLKNANSSGNSQLGQHACDNADWNQCSINEMMPIGCKQVNNKSHPIDDKRIGCSFSNESLDGNKSTFLINVVYKWHVECCEILQKSEHLFASFHYLNESDDDDNDDDDNGEWWLLSLLLSKWRQSIVQMYNDESPSWYVHGQQILLLQKLRTMWATQQQ